jgi:hypothetical protein
LHCGKRREGQQATSRPIQLPIGKTINRDDFFPASFNRLVGPGEQRGGMSDAGRPGGLQVDDELELGRLHDRQVGRFLALEDVNAESVAACLFHPTTVEIALVDCVLFDVGSLSLLGNILRFRMLD